MGSWSQTFNLKSGFTKSCHWKKNRKGKVSKVNKGIKRMRQGRERTAGEEHSRVSIRKPKNRLCVKMVPDYHIALDQPPSFSHSFIPTLRVFPRCLYCTSMWIVFFFKLGELSFCFPCPHIYLFNFLGLLNSYSL